MGNSVLSGITKINVPLINSVGTVCNLGNPSPVTHIAVSHWNHLYYGDNLRPTLTTTLNLLLASDHKYLRIRDLCKELAFVSRRANE